MVVVGFVGIDGEAKLLTCSNHGGNVVGTNWGVWWTNSKVIIQVVKQVLHFVDLHGILKGIDIFIEQSWRAVQPKGKKEVHIVEADCRSIWPLEVPR